MNLINYQNYKKTLQKRILKFFSFSLMLSSVFILSFTCLDNKNQNTVESHLKTIEKFDINKFNRESIINYSKKGIFPDTLEHLMIDYDTLNNGNITYKSAIYKNDVNVGYTEVTFPNSQPIIYSYKVFYPNGNLKEKHTKRIAIDGYLPSGQEYYYNTKGILIKLVNNDKIYKKNEVNPDILFDLLSDSKIFNYKRDKKSSICIWYNNKKLKDNTNSNSKIKCLPNSSPFWEVTKIIYTEDKETPTEKTYKIDAITAEIIEVSQEELIYSVKSNYKKNITESQKL